MEFFRAFRNDLSALERRKSFRFLRAGNQYYRPRATAVGQAGSSHVRRGSIHTEGRHSRCSLRSQNGRDESFIRHGERNFHDVLPPSREIRIEKFSSLFPKMRMYLRCFVILYLFFGGGGSFRGCSRSIWAGRAACTCKRAATTCTSTA